MRIYLVQHGKAVDKTAGQDRPLSAEGIQELEEMTDFLMERSLRAAEVWHSGKTRARQTGEILARAFGGAVPLTARAGLDPKAEIKPMVKVLQACTADVVIVGHLPHLSKLAGALLAGNAEAEPVAFRNAGVVCLEKSANGWQLCWAVTPELLARK